MNNLKVLIAGTSSSYLDISKKILSLHCTDCVVDFAHSGKQCVDKAVSDDYDVVLFDYHLGNKTGIEIIETLRRSPDNSALLIPLIEEGEENKARKCLESGANDYIIKRRGYLTALPFTLRNILERNDLLKFGPSQKSDREAEPEEGQIILDRTGRILSANQSMTRITDYSNEELLELKFADLLPKEKENSFYEWVNKVNENGNSQQAFQAEIQGKTGNRKYLNIVFTAIRDENKNIVSYRGRVKKIEGNLERVRLNDIEIDQVGMISRVSQAITTSYDEPLDALLQKFAEIACEVFGFQRSTIALLDKRKKAYVKQVMIAPRALKRTDNGSVEVPQEIVERIFLNKFRVKALYYNQTYTRSANLGPRVFERRTQKRRSQNRWHERDLVLANLTVKNGDSFGYISLDHPVSGLPPSREIFHNLELFAQLISMAVENYYQFSALEKRSRRLKQILVTSNIFKLYLSLNDLLKEVVWSIKFSLDFNLVTLALISKRTGSLEIKAVACDDKIKRQELLTLSFPLESVARLFRSEYHCEKSYMIFHEEKILESFKRIYHGSALAIKQNDGWPNCAVLLVPIKSKEDKIIGVLFVDDPVSKKVPSKDVIRTLEILANQVAVAIDNRILYVQAKRRVEKFEENGQRERAVNTAGMRQFFDRMFRSH
ncbi:MAG: response regulator [bacterium]